MSKPKNCPVYATVHDRWIRCAECDKRQRFAGTTRDEFYEKLKDFRMECPKKSEE